MRLERLRLQAFGPYVEEQQIDFQALAQKHLFLIRGETGAGKTAILDAITYALYGKSSGGERGDMESMRCRYAKAELDTFVELIFWIQDKRYRFYREVKVRKKRNGETAFKLRIAAGTYDQDEFLPFFENPKLKLVEEKAEALIGLTHTQFMQVMMLPQGKFEQLLVSKSEEKQEILKTLFQMENWSAICERLSEKLRDDKNHMEQLEQQMTLLLKQGKVTTIDELQEVFTQLEIEIKAVEEQEQHAKQQVTQWRQKCEEQQQLHAIQQRYQQQEQVYQSLCKEQEKMEHMRKQLTRMEQLANIKPYFTAYQQAIEEVKRRKHNLHQLDEEAKRLQEQKGQIEQLQKQLPKQKLDISLQEQKLHQGKEQCRQLQEMQMLYQTYEKQQKQCEQLEIEQNKQCKQEDALKQQVEQIAILLEQSQQSVQQYPHLVDEEQLYETGRKLHCDIVEKQKQLLQSAQEQQVLQKEMQSAQQKQQEWQRKHDVMYQQYLQNSAAMLAQLLEEGKPCPVCGSLHHVQTNQIQGTMIEAKQLQACKKHVDDCTDQVHKMELKLQEYAEYQQQGKKELAQKQIELSQVLADGYDEAKHETCKEQLRLCRKQIELSKTYQQKKTQIEKKQAEMQMALETLKKQLKEQNEIALVLKTKWQERKEGISLSFQSEAEGNNFVKQEEAKLAQLNQQLQQMEDAIHAYEMKQQQHTSNFAYATKECKQWQLREEEAKAAYEAQCDDTMKDLQEADFANVSYAEWKEQIQAFDTNMMQVQADRKALHAQLEGKTLEDINQVQQTLKTQEQQYDVIYTKYHALLHQQQLLQEVRHALQKHHQALDECRIAYGKRSEFVRAMRGDNSIGIERYVLGVMLSSITSVANTLLENVHDGRYRIYRSDESSGRTRKFGLELCIYDAYSCSQRPVVSLSGGEKFLVSLALSLALSTVVQARSGGIHMEAMFIDEGFGSLDEQSIQDALQVLSTMSQSKAMIGIISHVELLKENIPYGITVEKHKEGSQIHLLL